MGVSQHPDVTPFSWIVDESESTGWNYMAAYGPSGYSEYLKLDFAREPDAPQVVHLSPSTSEAEQIGIAAARLSASLGGSTRCFFCIWDGWPDLPALDNIKAEIPYRSYYLLRGEVSDLTDGWSIGGIRLPEPAFVWPTDRPWIIAKDVDFDAATAALSRDIPSGLIVGDTRLRASLISPYE